MGVLDILGFDIGNEYGCVSLIVDRNKDPMIMFPPPYKLNKYGMPTTAYLVPPKADEIIVFNKRPASDLYKRSPELLVPAIKRRLKEGHITVEGIDGPVSTDRIYAAIAGDMIRLVNEMRRSQGQDPVYDVVFTYPASFEKNLTLLNRMQQSIESVRLEDGHHIRVLGRLPEPAAVAIDYLFFMQNIVSEEKRIGKGIYTTLVYDLGHGTFDVAVVSTGEKDEPYKLLPGLYDGLDDVGGINFDDILYNELCRILKETYNYEPTNAGERSSIREKAINIKYDLTDSDTGTCNITLNNGETVTLEITRDRFEELGKPLINRTFELVDSILTRARENGVEINAVVLSGGASQMPMVRNGLEQVFGDEKLPIHLYRPSEAVSYGAARYASGLSDIEEEEIEEIEEIETDTSSNRVLEKSTDYSYGIWMPALDAEDDPDGMIHVMVESGKILPAKSEIMSVKSADSLTLRLYRSQNKGEKRKKLHINQEAKSLIRLPFDVPGQTKCDIQMIVLEDGNVKVVCTPNGGKTIERSTMDDFRRRG